MRFPFAWRAVARVLLLSALPVAGAIGLAACAHTPGTPVTVTVNLTQAQQMASQIDAAVAASLDAAQPAMSADQSAKAAQAKAALDVAVNAFVTAPSGTMDVKALAHTVLISVTAVVNAIPVIPPEDKLLVDTGAAVLDAFIANMPLTVPAPAPAAA